MANVAVTNTSGLYGITGNTYVATSAASLLSLLYSNGNVNFSLTGSGSQVQANALVSGGGGTYGNTQVAEYLASNTDPTISYLNANAAVQAVQINTLNANVGAYETWANANLATQTTNFNTLNANVGAFETYANLTFGTSNYSNVNVAAYLTTATINTTGNITGANLTTAGNVTASYVKGNGSLLTNLPVQQGTYTNANVTNLLSGGTYAGDVQALTGVVTAASINSTGPLSGSTYVQAGQGLYSIGTFSGTYSDGIVADYVTGNGRISVGTADSLTLYSGGVGTTPTMVVYPTGNVVIVGSVTAANVSSTNGYFWANGTAYSTGSGAYGNTQVAAYLPTYSGNIGRSSGTGNYLELTAPDVTLLSAGSSNTAITSGQYVNLTGGTGVTVNTPTTNFNNGNVRINSGSATSGGFLTVTNTATVGTVVTTNGVFWPNGASYASTVGYGNTQVAALVNSGTIPANVTVLTSQSTISAPGMSAYNGYNLNFSTVQDVTSTINLSSIFGNVNVISSNLVVEGDGSAIKQGNIIVPNGNVKIATGYFLGDGSLLTNLPSSAFTGNLAGNVLYDSVRNKSFANAFPLSTPDGTVSGNDFSNYVATAPVYTSGQLQTPVAPLGVVNNSGVTVITAQTANVGLVSSYQTTNNRNTVGATTFLGVTPVTANTMTNQDRLRATISAVDVNLGGKTWGTMSTTAQNGTTALGSYGISTVLQSGSLGSAVGTGGVVFVTPSTGNITLQYGTGSLSAVTLFNTGGTQYGGNIVNARLFAGFVSGFSSNLLVQNAIGLHTYNGWAGSGLVGAASNPQLGRYAVLNEDANTTIQTNGNLVVTGNTRIQALQETVAASGFSGGAWTVNCALGTIQTATLTSSISSLAFTNMPAGGTVTLIITQGGSGSYTLTTTGIKYAGASSTLSTAVGAIDMLNILFDGTNYYGSLVKGYA